MEVHFDSCHHVKGLNHATILKKIRDTMVAVPNHILCPNMFAFCSICAMQLITHEQWSAKTLVTFYYAGRLMGILIMVYYYSYIIPIKLGTVWSPVEPNQLGFLPMKTMETVPWGPQFPPPLVSINRGISTFRTTASRVAIKAKVGLQPLPATRCGFKFDLSHTFALVILFYYIHISLIPNIFQD